MSAYAYQSSVSLLLAVLGSAQRSIADTTTTDAGLPVPLDRLERRQGRCQPSSLSVRSDSGRSRTPSLLRRKLLAVIIACGDPALPQHERGWGARHLTDEEEKALIALLRETLDYNRYLMRRGSTP